MNSETPRTPATPRLDGTDSEQLAFFESQILAARNVERDIGQALYEIKSRRLFKVYGLNFGAYCQARFNFKKSRAYQLVKFAKACAAAVAAGELPPANEHAFREAAARSAGKGSGPAELARLQKILRDAVMAQQPAKRTGLIKDLQLFLARFARDLAANQPLHQPTPVAPIPAKPVQKPTLPVAAAADSEPAASNDARMTGAKSPADKAVNPSTAAGLNLATLVQNSQGLGGVTQLTMAQARQLGLA